MVWLEIRGTRLPHLASYAEKLIYDHCSPIALPGKHEQLNWALGRECLNPSLALPALPAKPLASADVPVFIPPIFCPKPHHKCPHLDLHIHTCPGTHSPSPLLLQSSIRNQPKIQRPCKAFPEASSGERYLCFPSAASEVCLVSII